MSQPYKIYREENYIRVVNALTNELFNGATKEVFVDKSNTQKHIYKIYNIKKFPKGLEVAIPNILNADGNEYSISEWETFYTENTANFGLASSGVVGGGAGDASAANQVTQTAVLNDLLKPASTLNKVSTLDTITNALPTGNNTIGNTNQTVATAEFAKITDGINTATVKASLGESSRTDKSLVVSLKANQASVGNVFGSITTALTSQVVIPTNLERKGFEIFNNSAGDLVIGIGITPTLTQGFLLSPQSMYSTLPMMTFTGNINIIGATIGQQFTYIEY